MNLEEIVHLFKPFRNPRIVGGVLLASIASAAILTAIEFKIYDAKVDKIYQNLDGTNAQLSTAEKVDFIRSSPQYSPTNSYVSLLDKIKPLK